MTARILVVDDEPGLLRLLSFILQGEGYDVTTAATGAEALRQVQTNRPDLMLLDVMLPDMSGLDVCSKVRGIEDSAHLPIIMISAKGQVRDKIGGIEAGADEYLTKPIDNDELVARVQGTLRRARQRAPAKATPKGKVLSFIGAKGGVGTTTVAVNICAALARSRRVIGVELRPYHGTFSSQLRRESGGSLARLLRLEATRITEPELANHLFSTAAGFRVLPAPQKVEEFAEIEPEHAEAILEGLADMADCVVVDLPCHPSRASQVAVRRSAFIALVVEPDTVCAESGRVILDLLESWGKSRELVGAVVVAHTALALPMKMDQVHSLLGCGIIGAVPPSADNLKRAAELCRPIVLMQPESAASGCLRDIADKLAADTMSFLRV
jgi:DNA-binding response OmpR family regulator